MHKLLLRQLRRYGGSVEAIPPEWQRFIAAVNEAYYQAEDDRALLERSLELASHELLERNQQLQKAKEAAEEGQQGGSPADVHAGGPRGGRFRSVIHLACFVRRRPFRAGGGARPGE